MMRDVLPIDRGFFDLKTLSSYSSCSVRWLRGRLTAQAHPLPCYRIGGKILVRREEFDTWMHQFKAAPHSHDLDAIVDDVLSQVTG